MEVSTTFVPFAPRLTTLTMANIAVLLRDMYVRIGFNNATAAAIIDPQGIDDLEELGNLTNKGVERLCKVQFPIPWRDNKEHLLPSQTQDIMSL